MNTETLHIKTEKQLIPQSRFPEFSDLWNEKTLREITKINQGLQIAISDRYTEPIENGHFYITNEFLKEGSTKKYYILNPPESVLCDEKDILMTRTGNTGQVVTGVNGAFHNNFFKIKFDANVDKDFLYFFLKSHRTQHTILKLAGTSTIPDLNHGDFYRIKLNLPTLPEQQKIASFLSKIDTKIQYLTQKKELLEQYKKGVMQQLFSQELRFKQLDGGDYPEWEEKTLKEVANFRRGSFPQPYGLPEWYDDNGAPFVQVYDVAENMKLKETTKQYISELAQKQSVFVEKGTLVITIQGSIGRIAKTQYDAFVDRTLLIFQSYKVKIDVDYFKYVVYLLFEIEKRKAPGGTIKTITKEKLSSFFVKIPCLEEQQKIANYLSGLDTKIDTVAQQITLSQQFKKGLLQQLFV